MLVWYRPELKGNNGSFFPKAFMDENSSSAQRNGNATRSKAPEQPQNGPHGHLETPCVSSPLGPVTPGNPLSPLPPSVQTPSLPGQPGGPGGPDGPGHPCSPPGPWGPGDPQGPGGPFSPTHPEETRGGGEWVFYFFSFSSN